MSVAVARPQQRAAGRLDLSVPVLAATQGEVLEAGFFEADFVVLPGDERRKVLDRLQEDEEP